MKSGAAGKEGPPMPAAASAALIVLVLGCTLAILHRQAARHRAAPGPAGTLEYRTAHPIDVCIDYLRHKNINDLFEYTCDRQADGSFLLHFTLHRPTAQPLDTLYTLRLDPGRSTVITLTFVREAFGYREPVFPKELLDAFLKAKLDAVPMQ